MLHGASNNCRAIAPLTIGKASSRRLPPSRFRAILVSLPKRVAAVLPSLRLGAARGELQCKWRSPQFPKFHPVEIPSSGLVGCLHPPVPQEIKRGGGVSLLVSPP